MLDINECENTTICPEASQCVNTIGDYHCSCPPGYTFDDNECKGMKKTNLMIILSFLYLVDLNECNINKNLCENFCINTPGGYVCSPCPEGFAMIDSQCQG